MGDLNSKAYDVLDSITQISKICEVALHNGESVKHKDELMYTILQV